MYDSVKKKYLAAPFSPILTAILVVSALIRLLGLFFLKDNVYSGDEIHYAEVAFKLLFNDFNPGFFQHYVLYFYIVSLFFLLPYGAGKLSGTISSAADYIVLFLEHQDIFFSLGRIVSVGFNLLTILLVYKVGKELGGRKTGVTAAFLFASFPLCSRTALSVSPYALTSFFILLSVFFFLKAIGNLSVKGFFYLGIIQGLAISSDFYAVVLYPIYLVILTLKAWGQKGAPGIKGKIGIFVLVSALVFSLFNFYLLANFKDFLWGVASQIRAVRFSEYGHEHSRLYYLRFLLELPYGILLPFFLLGLVTRTKERLRFSVLWAFPVFLIALLSFSKVQLPIYASHAMPFIAVVSALGLWEAVNRASSRKKMVFLYAFCCVFFVFSLPGYFWQPYSQYANEAKTWIQDNLPEHSRILVSPGVLYFPEQKASLFPEKNSGVFHEALDRYYQRNPGHGFQLIFDNFLKGNLNDHVDTEKVDYVVLPGRDYDRYSAQWLFANARLIKAYCGEGCSDTGCCRIRIYKILRGKEGGAAITAEQ